MIGQIIPDMRRAKKMTPRMNADKRGWVLLACIPLFMLIACSSKGLSTNQSNLEITQAATGVPRLLEGGSDAPAFPAGMPSTLRGRSVYTANCASCHGTYLTAVEKQELEKQAVLPKDHPDFEKRLKELKAERRWPLQESKVKPDFYSRDWRFQRTPGQLFQLIAYGHAPVKMGNASGAQFQHPGPSGKPGEGWINGIQAQRGSQLLKPGDAGPIWDVVFYVWSRSIAGATPTRFKDNWDTFTQNCSVCHGGIADGRGPLAHMLNPPPFNFTDRKALSETTDQFLFWRISEGGQFKSIPDPITETMSPEALRLYLHRWSAMPSWRGVLTEEQRWMLVDGVRSVTYEHE